MHFNDVVWLPNALIMTALLGAVAVWRWRRKGAISGLRWTGVAMLPLSLYAMGLFRLFWNVAISISNFATGFVWRPSVWIGLIMAVIAVALIVLPARLDRSLPGADGTPSRSSKKTKQVSSTKSRSTGDDDMDEIQDILKKHGIG